MHGPPTPRLPTSRLRNSALSLGQRFTYPFHDFSACLPVAMPSAADGKDENKGARNTSQWILLQYNSAPDSLHVAWIR
jgi:hypothetical protein